ncbi:MAG: DUF2178 domain-containing protein [Candidatus Uhrbacteria bacterium]|nr:DUF2178 domain-containing protein [Candidatus Uhrbacteria bacterium]
MTIKRYTQIRLALVFVIAMIISQSMVYRNFYIPLITVVVSSLLLIALRRRVKEVIADERDYATAGKAAFLAMQIFSWIGVIAMFALYAARDYNPSYEPMGRVIAFAVCLLMILYSVIFRFYNQFKFSDKKTIYTIAVGILLLILGIASLRGLSGEDDWICQNGAWVKHGNPSFPAPTAECK